MRRRQAPSSISSMPPPRISPTKHLTRLSSLANGAALTPPVPRPPQRPVVLVCSRTHSFTTAAAAAAASMADDSSYAAFLDRANADPSAGSATTAQHKQSPHRATTTTAAAAAAAAIPAPLRAIVHTDAHTYTSDTDSPWEPVSIAYPSSGGGSSSSSSSSTPSAQDFKQALATTASVEELQVGDFDPRDQYGGVIEAVQKAAGAGSDRAQVKIFRVQVDGTRVEYYIVSVDHAHNKLVGVVAKAVES